MGFCKDICVNGFCFCFVVVILIFSSELKRAGGEHRFSRSPSLTVSWSGLGNAKVAGGSAEVAGGGGRKMEAKNEEPIPSLLSML